MAQTVSIDLRTVAVACGALGALGTVAGGGIVALDAYIVHVINREALEARRSEWCGRELSGEAEKDRIIEDARAALGGCG